jgi:hypothetical protein
MLKEDEDDQVADRRAAPVGIRTFELRKGEENEREGDKETSTSGEKKGVGRGWIEVYS